jgi:hypothetical protein
MYGVGADATHDNSEWGAILMLRLVDVDESGEALAPFNATEFGIVGLRLRADGPTPDAPVQLGLSMVDDPAVDALPLNFSNNDFVLGGSSSGNLTTSGQVAPVFADFEQPEWTSPRIRP